MLFSIYIVQGKRDKVMVVESRWRIQVFIVPSSFSVPFDIFQIKHLEQNYQGFLQMNALWPRAPGYSPRLTAPAQPGDAPSLRPKAMVYRHSPAGAIVDTHREESTSAVPREAGLATWGAGSPSRGTSCPVIVLAPPEAEVLVGSPASPKPASSGPVSRGSR